MAAGTDSRFVAPLLTSVIFLCNHKPAVHPFKRYEHGVKIRDKAGDPILLSGYFCGSRAMYRIFLQPGMPRELMTLLCHLFDFFIDIGTIFHPVPLLVTHPHKKIA
jgi:hypothetical protein